VNCTSFYSGTSIGKYAYIDWSGSKPSLTIWEGFHAIINEWNEHNRWTVREWKDGHGQENETNWIQGLVFVACVLLLWHWHVIFRATFHKPKEIMWKLMCPCVSLIVSLRGLLEGMTCESKAITWMRKLNKYVLMILN
jgi:hypothetical protein